MDKSAASMNASKTAMDPSVCALSLIDASNWACVDFISDLHLQAREPEVFEAFEYLLENTSAQALFILGDLFELWVGDDELDSPQGEFARRCVSALQAASRRLPLYLMPGNRDFLLSHHFYTQARVQALTDPAVLRTPERSYLLSHGDLLCTSDHAYQGFRETVRSETWQSEFLSQSLNKRLSLGQDMRAKSTAMQREQGLTQTGLMFDLDAQACRDWLTAHQCQTLIHGHTHAPRQHDLGPDLERVVLSDWEANSSPPRLEVLRLEDNTLKRLHVLACGPAKNHADRPNT